MIIRHPHTESTLAPMNSSDAGMLGVRRLTRFMGVSVAAFGALFTILLITQLVFPGKTTLFSKDFSVSVLPKLRIDYDFLAKAGGDELALYYINSYIIFFILFIICFLWFGAFILTRLPPPPPLLRNDATLVRRWWLAVAVTVAFLIGLSLLPTPFYSRGHSVVFSVPINSIGILFAAFINYSSLLFLSITCMMTIQMARSASLPE